MRRNLATALSWLKKIKIKRKHTKCYFDYRVILVSVKASLDYYELNKHTPWLEGSSELFNQINQARLQWSQEHTQRNGNNLSSIRREDSRYFGNKK
jgi:hypothetical protein